MTQIEHLTPETLLSAPRRSPAIPNRAGTLALHTIFTHQWGIGNTTKALVMDLESTESWDVVTDAAVHDVSWIPGTDDDIIYLKSCKKGKTEVCVTKGAKLAAREHVKILELDAPVANLKLKKLEDHDVAFVVTGLVGDQGSLYNEEAHKEKSSGRVYDTVNIRQWEIYYNSQRYSLWYNTLSRQHGQWKLSGDLHCLIDVDHLEAPFNMYDKADPLNYFDISYKGIAFFARDLKKERTPAKSSAAYPYFVHITSFKLPPSQHPKLISANVRGDSNFGSNIRFCPDANHIAFLWANSNDGCNVRLYMTDIISLEAFDVLDHFNIEIEEHDLPNAFEFTRSCKTVLLVSEVCGRNALSILDLAHQERPKVIYKEGSIADVYPLKENDFESLLISTHSFLDSSLWQVLTLRDTVTSVRLISSATKHGKKYSLSKSQIREIWFPGADDIPVHAYLLYPSHFDENKKWPWVFLPHGGPEQAWADEWSTRWNLLAWAQQGFVIVAPNVSGSTGFGLEFSRRVKRQYGGKPFEDCLKLLDHLDELPYLDSTKAIFAGASYGGYLGSWFFCHDVIKKFCGAVWHDGIFSIPMSMLEQDKSIDDGEFGGDPNLWSNFHELHKWDPATPARLRNWKDCPPTIVIHSAKDYRCPTTEGIATFKTLQGLGVPSRFLTFDDEGHWVTKPENSLMWHKEVFGWMRRCVNGDLKRGDNTW